MKVILLIASFILLVVASPLPPKHNRDGDINPLSTGIHESDTSHSTANRVPTAPDRQRNTQDNTYLFGTTVDGKDVTLELKLPQKLQPLRDLPNELDSWDDSALDKLENAIFNRYMIIRKVLDDANLIYQASRLVRDGEIGHRAIDSSLLQTITMPLRPQPGPDFKGRLLKIIKDSHQRLQNAIANRNSKLATLSNIIHADDFMIHNASGSTPNLYVSYVKENKIPFMPKKQQPVPGTYSFGNTQDGKNVTQGIGRREEMINIISLPQGLAGFGAPELGLIAKNISDKASLVRDVLNDRDRIQDAIKSLQKKAISHKPGKLKELDLSAVSSGANDKTELLRMIQTCHKKLRDAVHRRNGSLRKLYQLQVPLTDFDTADHTNVYVAYWKENQTLPPAGASNHPTSSLEPSKRLKTGDIDRDKDPELYDMLEEMHQMLGHS
ncbi:hypothetical protein H0H93_010077 [Arthromyces matolae]|nr:hypothetical protein H0H93_010077 [Arthromyces matolae]